MGSRPCLALSSILSLLCLSSGENLARKVRKAVFTWMGIGGVGTVVGLHFKGVDSLAVSIGEVSEEHGAFLDLYF